MTQRDDADRRRRRALGDRSDANREYFGKKPFTDSEREEYLDHAMWEERQEREAEEDRRERCARIRDTAIGGTIAGSVGGAVAALLAALLLAIVQWVLPRISTWFGLN